jgi:choline dehydrogenase-like flavoprotein
VATDRAAAEFDAVVAGGGGAGCLAAWRLAARGLRVAVVERGGPPPGSACDLPALRRPPAVRLLHRPDPAWPYQGPYRWLRAVGLGGRLNYWLGTALRFEPGDFEHWPIGYGDLAPYYDELDDDLGSAVAGPFPCDVVDEWLAAAAASCGARLVPARQARARPGPVPATATAAFASVSPLDRWLPVALATGRCTVLPSTVVRRVLTGEDGSARGLEVVTAGSPAPLGVRARAVVLATSTIETARLLLDSATPDRPGGLGNGSGLVGRHLMDHVVVWARALLRLPNGTAWDPRRPAQTAYIPDWPAAPAIPPTARPWRFQVQAMVHGGGDGLAALALAGLGEGLPQPGNEVVLDPASARDPNGCTVPLVRFGWDEAHRALAGRIRDALVHLVDALPADVVAADVDDPEGQPRLGGFGHEVGTARMGAVPGSSVCSAAGEVHGTPGLFVVDGSLFVSYPHRNPTLTILANCARVCDGMAARR